MPSLFDRLSEDQTNPLDNIEEILNSNDWSFDRMSNNELSVELSGKFCEYRLTFLWQTDLKALQLNIQYEMDINPTNLAKAAQILMTINEQTWMGHFEISSNTCIPNYRYTTLLNADDKNAYEQLENIVDIALAQCETNYTAFNLLKGEDAANDETLPLALMQVQGIS